MEYTSLTLGLIIEVGDKSIDLSISARLNKLNKLLTDAIWANKYAHLKIFSLLHNNNIMTLTEHNSFHSFLVFILR